MRAERANRFMKPTSIAKLIALCLVGASLYLTFALERSPKQPDQWNLGITLTPLNVGLLAVAAAIFWFASRRSKKPRE
jgi:hypothetical protein